ncbi:MAG: rhodanese-like domain-containing protein [Desulfovermiculus sp.]|nr:rhodanese-like domain-containing protein [Desulfovermiculus sp.]
MKHRRFAVRVFVFCFALLFFFGCDSSEAKFIKNSQLSELIDEHKCIKVVDVRNPYELEGNLGKIEGSVNVPLKNIDTDIEKHVPNKNTYVVLVCRTHNRSQAAYHKLKEKGYTNLYVLLGGMVEHAKKHND